MIDETPAPPIYPHAAPQVGGSYPVPAQVSDVASPESGPDLPGMVPVDAWWCDHAGPKGGVVFHPTCPDGASHDRLWRQAPSTPVEAR